MEEEKSFKIVFFGYTGCGKTCIINRLIGKSFIEYSEATSVYEYFHKSLKIEGHLFYTNILDTIGVGNITSLTKIFLKDAKGVFVVYDVTYENSFESIDKYIKFIKEIGNNDDTQIFIIGNKCDLIKNRKVTFEQGESKAKEYGADFIETSALSGKNIEEAFEIMMKKVIIKELEKNDTEDNKKILKSLTKEIKKLKKVKDVSNDIKNEYDKLKKDYDKLQKNYDKLKNDNDRLNNELNKAKNIISNFDKKEKENIDEINNLKNIILQKEDEINILNLKLKNIETFDKKIFNNNDIISVHFISSAQNINCPIKCLSNETFAEVEERLYQKHQEYRETNNNFASKGKVIMRFKKLIENNINNGDKIELIKIK